MTIFLYNTFKICLRSLEIPKVKTGKIIPIHKPISSNLGSSYRLLAPIVKVLKADLFSIFKENTSLIDQQRGFRTGRSITTTLYETASAIRRGPNSTRSDQSSIVAALDLSRAFDMVVHSKLPKDIHSTNLPN